MNNAATSQNVNNFTCEVTMATAKQIVKPYGLDVREVAKISGFSASTLHVWAKRGDEKKLRIVAAGINALRKESDNVK